MCYLGSVLKLLAVILTAVVHLHAAAAQTKITIGYAAVSPRTTPLYIAQEQGIFSKYGLDAKIVLFRGAPTMPKILAMGQTAMSSPT
jgi:ABC-type nitrate/sulfonate/bicarbonate transport system substrate-binding protein